MSSDFPIETSNDLLMLAHICAQRHDYELAINLLKSDEKAFPLGVNELVLLAHCYNKVSLFHGAVLAYKSALELEPDRPDILVDLGFAYDKFSDRVSAFATLKKCVDRFPNFGQGHARISTIYAYLEKVDLCLDHAETAFSLDPNNTLCQHSLIHAYRKANKKEKAIKLTKKLIASKPTPANLYTYVALTKPKIGDPYVKIIDKQLSSSSLDIRSSIQLNYSKATACAQSGQYKKAIEIWNKAGQLDQERRRFSLKNTQLQFADIYSAFTKPISRLSMTAAQTSAKASSTKPIFILGMPRSGTSLVEQIIASHSEVSGLGELEAFNKIFNVKNFLKSEINDKNLLRLREIYFEEVALFEPKTARFTDKMPANFRYLGFMSAAFPDAKIIHIKRSPTAVCFSNFKTFFGAEGMLWSSSQTDVVEYYKMYSDLMNFWNMTFSNNFLEVQYETLTEKPNETIKQILDYCDLPFEQSCIDFHTSDRVVLTASQDQVKQGMYKGSSREWRKYSDYIQPMLGRLQHYQFDD